MVIRGGWVGVADLMIRFPCTYCGQPVSAKEELAGERIECPACGHVVWVHPGKPGGALKTSRGERGERVRKDADHWRDKSNEEILDWVRSRTLSKAERRVLVAKRLCAPLLPRYDDLTLFALSVTFVLLLLLNANLREGLITIFTAGSIGFEAILLAMAGLGMVFALVNVFLKRQKSNFEKVMTLFFAVLVTVGTGLCAGSIVVQKYRGWLMIFPAWNEINGLLLLALAHLGILDTDCITDERASGSQILVAVVSITMLLMVCQYIFRLHWLVAYSIAICYTMSLLSAVQDIVGKQSTAK